jgi:histidine triad (HIT) family protein
MENCIFCAILAGSAPASIVYQDELVTAFMDIRPINPGHTLIIPNQHATHLQDLDPEVGAHLFRVGQRVASALYQSGLRCEGVNFFLADGEAAGQDVFHVHLHIFPRFKKDGFGLKFGPAYFQKGPDREELSRVAEKIKEALK